MLRYKGCKGCNQVVTTNISRRARWRQANFENYNARLTLGDIFSLKQGDFARNRPGGAVTLRLGMLVPSRRFACEWPLCSRSPGPPGRLIRRVPAPGVGTRTYVPGIRSRAYVPGVGTRELAPGVGTRATRPGRPPCPGGVDVCSSLRFFQGFRRGITCIESASFFNWFGEYECSMDIT